MMKRGAKGGVALLLATLWTAGSTALAQQPHAAARNPALDLYGDPLPSGAIARLGTVRFRHSSFLYDLLVSPDGRTFISAGGNSVEIWDAQSGRRLRQILFASPDVNGIELTPDGKLLAVAQQRFQKMRFWDLVSGAEVHPFGDAAPVSMKAALSPNGELLATLDGPRSPTVSIWDMRRGKKIRTIEGVEHSPSRLRSLAFSPNGKLLVFPHGSGFRVWDVVAGKDLYQLDLGAKVRPGCAAFSSDSTLLAAATYPVPINSDHTIHLWDMATGKEIGTLKGHEAFITSLVASPRGNVLASASWDETIRFWDLQTRRETSRHPGYSSTRALAFHRDGRTMISGDVSGAIHRWTVDKGRDNRNPVERANTVDWVAFAPDGRTLLTTGEGKFGRWEPLTGQPRHFVDAQLPRSSQKALSPDGAMLALVASKPGQILLWDVATGKLVRRFGKGGQRGLVYSCRFSPDGRRLAGGSIQEEIVRIWDTASGKEIMQLTGQRAPGTLAFSPDGRTLASASGPFNGDFTVRLCSLATGAEIWRQTTRPWAAVDMTFSPDGRTLVVGGGIPGRSNEPGELHLLDAATGKERLRFEGHRDQVRSVAFSADGRMLATGSLDQTIRLWEVATGRERRRFQNQKLSSTGVSLSPDGRLLASAGFGDASALVWDLTDRFREGRFQTRRLSAAELHRCWIDLAEPDAVRAYQSICALTGSPKEASAFLKDHLPPVRAANPEHVAPLLAALDSEQFTERDKAMTELEHLGLAVEPALHAALDRKPSLEVRRRIEAILDKLAGGPRVRFLRALEVLEHLATPEARPVLETLSTGTAGMWPTQEAKASLERLKARPLVR